MSTSLENDEHGKILRTKSRLVAFGYKQRKVVDVFKIFSVSRNLVPIRISLAVAVKEGSPYCHVDTEQEFVKPASNSRILVRLHPCLRHRY